LRKKAFGRQRAKRRVRKIGGGVFKKDKGQIRKGEKGQLGKRQIRSGGVDRKIWVKFPAEGKTSFNINAVSSAPSLRQTKGGKGGRSNRGIYVQKRATGNEAAKKEKQAGMELVHITVDPESSGFREKKGNAGTASKVEKRFAKHSSSCSNYCEEKGGEKEQCQSYLIRKDCPERNKKEEKKDGWAILKFSSRKMQTQVNGKKAEKGGKKGEENRRESM